MGYRQIIINNVFVISGRECKTKERRWNGENNELRSMENDWVNGKHKQRHNAIYFVNQSIISMGIHTVRIQFAVHIVIRI